MSAHKSERKKIAIFGASSHIAKGLIDHFLRSGGCRLHLYTRSPDKVRVFIQSLGIPAGWHCAIHNGYQDFNKNSYDAVINCVGVGPLNKMKGLYSSYFTVTEKYDNMVIGYLLAHPETQYICLSSGVVYGRGLAGPAEGHTRNCLEVNRVALEDSYAIVRLNSEAKHRSFTGLKIVDLRVFSYFSRYIDLTDGYFITEVLNAVLNKTILETDRVNIIRDYVHPADLFEIVQKCLRAGRINVAYDVSSTEPVSKRDVLNHFKTAYGLKVHLNCSMKCASATGAKNVYCSKFNKASEIGYRPRYSSLETLKREARYILNHKINPVKYGGRG